jgi:hypothetical protein
VARAPLVDWLGGIRPADHPVVVVPSAVDAALRAGAVAAGFAFLFWLVVRFGAARLAPFVVVGPLAAANLAVVPTLDREAVLGFPAWMSPLAADANGAPIARAYRDKKGAFVSSRLGPLEIAVLAHESGADHQLVRHGLAEVPGYHTTAPPREKALWRAAEGPALERLLDLFDVKWALLPDGDRRQATLVEVARTPVGYRLLENPARRPRGFVAPRWRWVPDARSALLASEVDFHAIRLDGEGPAGEAAGTLVPCAVEVVRPEEVIQRCDASTGGHAVLLDAWSPGWSVTVDGVPAEVLRAESIARAVPVGPGPHVVVWRYRAPGLRAGAALAACAWLLWLLTARRGRGAPRAPS